MQRYMLNVTADFEPGDLAANGLSAICVMCYPALTAALVESSDSNFMSTVNGGVFSTIEGCCNADISIPSSPVMSGPMQTEADLPALTFPPLVDWRT